MGTNRDDQVLADAISVDARGWIRGGDGRVVGVKDGNAWVCMHDHKHRTAAAFVRCLDGPSGAATGSRLAKR